MCIYVMKKSSILGLFNALIWKSLTFFRTSVHLWWTDFINGPEKSVHPSIFMDGPSNPSIKKNPSKKSVQSVHFRTSVHAPTPVKSWKLVQMFLVKKLSQFPVLETDPGSKWSYNAPCQKSANYLKNEPLGPLIFLETLVF